MGKPGQAVPSDESSQHDPPGGPGLVPLEVAVVTGEITVGGREVTIVSGGVLVCDTEGAGIMSMEFPYFSLVDVAIPSTK